MKADAVVVAYRSAAVIRQCVAALRSDPSIDRIVVVNNSAGDDTIDAVSQIDNVVYIESPQNIGFGSAVNLARSYITAPYVVLANPDTQQSCDTTTDLLQFLDDRPAAAMVAPRLYTADGDVERNSQHDLTLPRMAFQAIGWPQATQVMRPRSAHLNAHITQCLIGAFVLCRVKALDEVAWFDESIFLFGEDQDLCRRLRAVGWELWFAPVGRVEHLDGHSWQQLADRGKALFREARARELRKASGPLGAGTYRLLARVRDAFR